ncbi:zinc finger protein, putative [Medicago truncatula]|uniref:Zinc finger protein, putative n=1 Tax=Medicago truncatula TaxID=3880 RepID=G7J0Z3_MEDTR|nr:zinc finger protein, putative [Medicago truncatula]
MGQETTRNPHSKVESSNSNNTQLVCEICTETKRMKDVFYISCCSHAYCSDCIAKYIRFQLCRSILPVVLFERWCKALCEALFVLEKFYCPFRDCARGGKKMICLCALFLVSKSEGCEPMTCRFPFCLIFYCIYDFMKETILF